MFLSDIFINIRFMNVKNKNIAKNGIYKFVKNLNTFIDNDKSFIKRNNGNNKLNFRNTLYASTLTLNYSGLSNVICDLKINNIADVSKTALIKKRNNQTTNLCIKNLNDNIINMLYNPDNKFIHQCNFKIDDDKTSYIKTNIKKSDKSLFINKTNKRFIGCDGTQINLNKSLINNNGIKKSSNGEYGVCILSSIYDIINNIPINYNITKCNTNDINKKKVNETNGFLDQLSYLTENDIVIFDRWYYSNMLIKKLNKEKIGYIFRMKSSSLFFKNMHYGKSKIVTYDNFNVQIFKYKIKNEIYYILTSITDNISVKEIKALYQKRWAVETDNKKIKYDILYNNFRSKKYNSFLVDIETMRFMSIISSVIEYIGKDTIDPKTKINSKNCLSILYKKLLYLLLYKNKCDEIFKIIGIIQCW